MGNRTFTQVPHAAAAAGAAVVVLGADGVQEIEIIAISNSLEWYRFVILLVYFVDNEALPRI